MTMMSPEGASGRRYAPSAIAARHFGARAKALTLQQS